MARLSKLVEEYIALVERAETLVAMERFFSDEVVLFENHELVAAGRANALARERDALAKLAVPPRYRSRGFGVSPDGTKAFIEWETRFLSGTEYSRLDEVVVQEWYEEKIVLERHYYEGVVQEWSEGDAS